MAMCAEGKHTWHGASGDGRGQLSRAGPLLKQYGSKKLNSSG